MNFLQWMMLHCYLQEKQREGGGGGGGGCGGGGAVSGICPS